MTIQGDEGDGCRVQVGGGPLVTVDGDEVAVRGELARALLVRLALADGTDVTAADLVPDLWDAPPETAAVSVRVTMSKLRGGPLAPYLDGGRGGYRLRATEVDLLQAQAILRDHSADPDLELLTEPWMIDPLSEFTDRPFGRRWSGVHRGIWRSAVERAGRRALDEGRPERATAALLALVETAPTAEEPVRLAALTLAAAGRPGAAIEVLDAFRERLAEGWPVAPDLVALRAAILRFDPEVVPRRGGRAQVHGIPLPLTRLIGRSTELADLDRARTSARLVTLTGPAGVGKTRLAVEHAHTTATVDDDRYFIDLAVAVDPARTDLDVATGASAVAEAAVAAAVSTAVGADGGDLESLVRRLDSARTLLVLDNAEHVLGATRAVLAGLLGRCAGLAAVVTSREALQLAGEWIVPVQPLPRPAALELFGERSAHARGGHGLSDGETVAAQQLCIDLDGIPLALELAAARTATMAVGQTARSILATTAPAAVGSDRRHASLADAVGWSVRLLDTDELLQLALLARFAGPVDPDTVAAVCPGGPEAVQLTVRLAEKSLVSASRHGDAVRYRLLDSVRGHVLRTLPVPDAHDWDRRHLAWFADLVDRLEPGLRSGLRPVNQQLLDDHAADLARALDTAVAADDREAALRVAGGQTEHWLRRGQLQVGRTAVERALAVPEPAGWTAGSAELRALVGAALLCFQSGDMARALDHAMRALGLAEQLGDRDHRSLLLAYAAYGRSLSGLRDEADALAAAAGAELEALVPWVRCSVLLCLGQTHRALGRPASAIEALGRARRIAVDIGYSWIATSATYVTGKVLVDQRRGVQAIDLLVRGSAEAIGWDDPTGALALLHVVGGATTLVGRERVGAVIFAAIDSLGRRYDYNPVTAEGEDALIHRQRVAAALSDSELGQARSRGERLDLEELQALAGRLLAAAAA